jgi:hypothetical protein
LLLAWRTFRMTKLSEVNALTEGLWPPRIGGFANNF